MRLHEIIRVGDCFQMTFTIYMFTFDMVVVFKKDESSNYYYFELIHAMKNSDNATERYRKNGAKRLIMKKISINEWKMTGKFIKYLDRLGWVGVNDIIMKCDFSEDPVVFTSRMHVHLWLAKTYYSTTIVPLKS
jgi:hypothetical protein